MVDIRRTLGKVRYYKLVLVMQFQPERRNPLPFSQPQLHSIRTFLVRHNNYQTQLAPTHHKAHTPNQFCPYVGGRCYCFCCGAKPASAAFTPPRGFC
jgi:hypothetical protein